MKNDIGWAVAQLKAGKAVQRTGWNGKGMFLFLLPEGNNIPTKIIHDPALRAVAERELGGDTFDALASVCMFTADKKILTGWLCSQTDLLADDWQEYAVSQESPQSPSLDDEFDELLPERQTTCEGDTCDSCQ